MKACVPAQITAFGCASSAATLPVTLNCARAYGLQMEVANFCINVGTTVNMDGAAIQFPIAVIFQGAALGITFSFIDCFVIVLISSLSAIGD